MKISLALAAGLLLVTSLAQAAEIRVLSGNGAKAAVRELCTQFERATGNKINLHFEVNADIQKKIADLSAKRQKKIDEELAKTPKTDAEKALDEALKAVIREQAKAKGFETAPEKK